MITSQRTGLNPTRTGAPQVSQKEVGPSPVRQRTMGPLRISATCSRERTVVFLGRCLFAFRGASLAVARTGRAGRAGRSAPCLPCFCPSGRGGRAGRADSADGTKAGRFTGGRGAGRTLAFVRLAAICFAFAVSTGFRL